jgi:hypothetical protein
MEKAMKKNILVLVLFVLATAVSFAQTGTAVQDLNDAIRNGQARLTANGNGGSSGMAVEGFLRNLTSGELRININIDMGIYLVNSGKGQNMVGTQIYLKGGKYSSDGTRSFIVLQPRANMEVNFLAFCADLELGNPSSGESFSIDSMPAEIGTIAAKINRYEREHPDENLVTIAQVALWRSRGKTWSEISRYFRFTQNDWDNASVLLNY